MADKLNSTEQENIKKNEQQLSLPVMESNGTKEEDGT